MKTLTAKDIMNRQVITVRENMTVHQLASFLTDKMISGAPVVDENQNLVGVVSMSDIVRNDAHRAAIIQEHHDTDFYLTGWEDDLDEEEMELLHIEEEDNVPVRDIMTPLIFKVEEDTSLADMAKMMIGGRIHRLIVTRGTKVTGIVTTLDMLKAIRDTT